MIDFQKVRDHIAKQKDRQGYTTAYDPVTRQGFDIHYCKTLEGALLWVPLEYLQQEVAHKVVDTVESLMDAIKTADVEPAVYNVLLSAASHFSGFYASVSFRRPHAAGPASLEAHADTPEGALRALLDTLQKNFGRCEHCGQYKQGGNDE